MELMFCDKKEPQKVKKRKLDHVYLEDLDTAYGTSVSTPEKARPLLEAGAFATDTNKPIAFVASDNGYERFAHNTLPNTERQFLKAVPKLKREHHMCHLGNETSLKTVFRSSGIYESLGNIRNDKKRAGQQEEFKTLNRLQKRSLSFDNSQAVTCCVHQALVPTQARATEVRGNLDHTSLHPSTVNLSNEGHHNSLFGYELTQCCQDFKNVKVVYIFFVFNIVLVAFNIAVCLSIYSTAENRQVTQRDEWCFSCTYMNFEDHNIPVTKGERCCLTSETQLLTFVTNVTEKSRRTSQQDCCATAAVVQANQERLPVVQYSADGTFTAADNTKRVKWKSEENGPIQRVFGKLDHLDKSTVTIPTSGLYFVFARVTNYNSDINYSVVVDGGEKKSQIIESFDENSLPVKEAPQPAHYRGSLFSLRQGDKIFIKIEGIMSFEDLDKRNTKLGLFYVSSNKI